LKTWYLFFLAAAIAPHLPAATITAVNLLVTNFIDSRSCAETTRTGSAQCSLPYTVALPGSGDIRAQAGFGVAAVSIGTDAQGYPDNESNVFGDASADANFAVVFAGSGTLDVVGKYTGSVLGAGRGHGFGEGTGLVEILQANEAASLRSCFECPPLTQEFSLLSHVTAGVPLLMHLSAQGHAEATQGEGFGGSVDSVQFDGFFDTSGNSLSYSIVGIPTPEPATSCLVLLAVPLFAVKKLGLKTDRSY
jgi:hypothetical protein